MCPAWNVSWRLLVLMATCVATDILSADSQKLLVQFRTVEHCSSYIARTRTAHHLFSIPLAGKHAAMMTRSQQENVRQPLQYLRSIAAVSTENPDSLRRVLRCDSSVVHVWSPLRYRIDRMGRGEPRGCSICSGTFIPCARSKHGSIQ